MTAALTALQLLGVLAVLVGAAILLPLGWAVLVDGLLVAATATAAEYIVSRRKAGAS